MALATAVLLAFLSTASSSLATEGCAVASQEQCEQEVQVEEAEALEAEALRTELLQRDARHFKGPLGRSTPASVLVSAVLDTQADSDVAQARRANGLAGAEARGPATPGATAAQALAPLAAANATVGAALAAMGPVESVASSHAGLALPVSDAAPAGVDSWPFHSRHAPGAAVHAEHGPTVHVAGHGKDENYVKQAAIPVGAFIVGGVIILAGQKTAGMLSIYFGAQAGFSLYMKVVLSNAFVSKELKMKGVPAAFLVTAVQQLVAFVILALVLAVLRFTPREWLGLSEPYRPKQLNTTKEWVAMTVFAVAFALNIGLNNFSLSLLTVSLNLIIRSCLPLVTLVMQLLTGTAGQLKGLEVLLMVSGVLFAGLATVASSHGHKGAATSHLVLGVIMCASSDIAAALNLVLASVFGTHMKLNPLDTTFYMAVPAAVSLVPAIFLLHHPVEWPGYDSMTDWSVFLKVLELSPYTLCLIGLSGIFAVGYNVLQYSVVQILSASHAAFAGNFNKAATIMLSICLGLESLPPGAWAGLMMFAILGNIASFTGYSLLKGGDGKHAPPPPQSEATAKA